VGKSEETSYTLWGKFQSFPYPITKILLEKFQSFSDSREIPSILWNPQVYYHEAWSLVGCLYVAGRVVRRFWRIAVLSASAYINHLNLQEHRCMDLTPRVHYRVHKSPSLIRILSHTDPLQIVQFDLLKIHFKIILPSMLTSSYPLFSSFSANKTSHAFSSSCTCHMLLPSYLPLYDQPSNIWPGMQDTKFLITQFSPCFSYVFPPRP